MTGTTRAYWVVRPGVGEVRREEVSEVLTPGRALVRAEVGGVSVGTERLVGLGLVPPECAQQMACRSMGGSFALPVKYGYSLVGTVISGRLEGRRVFVMHPHQELAEIAEQDAVILPAAVPSLRATLIPNLETALNAVWDAELGSGERHLVFGAGIVGLLVAFALHKTSGARTTIVEPDPQRRAIAAACPWIAAAIAPDEVTPASAEVVFHCTGRTESLDQALHALAFEGRVVELSWYGARAVTVSLGTHFHFRRLRILASQVGSVARSRRESHGRAGLLAEMAKLLEDPALDRLPTAPIPFARLPELMTAIYCGTNAELAPTISYG